MKLWRRSSKRAPSRKRPSARVAIPAEPGRIEVDGGTIEFEVRRSTRRRKTVQVRVDRGQVIVAAPSNLSTATVDQIVRKRAVWIQQQLAEQPLVSALREFESGETVPYLGRNIRLQFEETSASKVSVRLLRGSFAIEVPTPLAAVERREAISEALEAWYRDRASERIAASVERWCTTTGHQPGPVLIRNQRRRWASCGADGTLRFNWRLVLGPTALLDYVVVHELVHLEVRNHSYAFWAGVERWLPDYRERRTQLRDAAPSMTL